MGFRTQTKKLRPEPLLSFLQSRLPYQRIFLAESAQKMQKKKKAQKKQDSFKSNTKRREQRSIYQVIQFVTFWSPNVGLVTWDQPLISGHVFTHHPKKGHDRRIARYGVSGGLCRISETSTAESNERRQPSKQSKSNTRRLFGTSRHTSATFRLPHVSKQCMISPKINHPSLPESLGSSAPPSSFS